MLTATKRVFLYNGKTLPDPNPALSAEKALALYKDQYPELVNASLGEADVDPAANTVTYEVTTKTGTAG